MTSALRMRHLGQPPNLAWAYFGKDDAENPDPESLLTPPSWWVARSSLLLGAGAQLLWPAIQGITILLL